MLLDSLITKCLSPRWLLRNTVFAVALSCMALTAYADNSPQLLQNIQKQLTTDNVIRGEFTQQRQLSGVKKTLHAQGHFTVDKQRGVIWQTVKPFNQSTQITRREITQKDGSQILMKMSADKEPVVKTISSVLFAVSAGDVQTLTSYFNHDGSINGHRWQITFTPKNAALAKVIRELQLSGGNAVQHVVLTGASGDITRIEFKLITVGKTLTADEIRQFE